jgi:lactate dehydrogenase-like 2-hydroxyacid dehydrogenase
MKKIVITRGIFDDAVEYLEQNFSVVSNQQDHVYPRDELVEMLQGADGVQITSTERVDDELLGKCPTLKAVCNTAVGYNNIDVDACTRRGVMVTNTPGVLDNSVADYAVGLMIATCRRMCEGERYLRAGEFKGVYLKQTLSHDVHGATLGIFGFGRIGQTIAKRVSGFDMNILYHTRKRVAPDIETKYAARYVDKQELLRQADIVMLILPYSPDTHHYIGADELALMKPSAVLVNMARGGIVDDAALVDALKNKTIWAAGLDVYENEPKFNPGFLQLENVVLSPHIASAAEPTRRAMSMTAARNLVAALTSGEPPNLVNPDYRKFVQT